MKNNLIKYRGFTLIELLIVIAMMVVLAGLSTVGYKFVIAKQKISKTTVQVALLSQSIEAYKGDNGVYPPLIGGIDSSSSLFRALYWDSNGDGISIVADPDQTVYLNELDPGSNKQQWLEGSDADTRIIDPWGSPFIYRLFGVSPNFVNPDFDLISKGSDGAIDEASETAVVNDDNITNY